MIVPHDALLRQDFSSFIQKAFHTLNPGMVYEHNWHIDLIGETLAACTRGEVRRLIINMPPRCLKSLSVSVAWPAWLLGNMPSRRVLVASYAQSLAVKHALDCRRLIQAPWFREVFPHFATASDQNTKHKLLTSENGFRLATSVGGSVTGEGGNFLIVDDPHNPSTIFSNSMRRRSLRWFDQTFASRMDDRERGVFVVVMQRLHEEDLTGHLLAKAGEGWQHLSIPAYSETSCIFDFGYRMSAGSFLHRARLGEGVLSEISEDLGGYAFSAQYLQDPVPESGGMIQPGWLQRFDVVPDGEGYVVQSWDTAIKAASQHDYSVCTVWKILDGNAYLLDVWRGRVEFPDLKRNVLELAEQWRPEAILIEDKASGQSLLQELRLLQTVPLIGMKVKQDKITRMAQVSPLLEAGRVWFPKQAKWLAVLETELLRFPAVSHDDQVDSISQFLHWWRHHTPAPSSQSKARLRIL